MCSALLLWPCVKACILAYCSLFRLHVDCAEVDASSCCVDHHDFFSVLHGHCRIHNNGTGKAVKWCAVSYCAESPWIPGCFWIQQPNWSDGIGLSVRHWTYFV